MVPNVYDPLQIKSQIEKPGKYVSCIKYIQENSNRYIVTWCDIYTPTLEFAAKINPLNSEVSIPSS